MCEHTSLASSSSSVLISVVCVRAEGREKAMTPCQALFHVKIIAYRHEFDNEMGCNQQKNTGRMHLSSF